MVVHMLEQRCDRLTEDSGFGKKIFLDEAHFNLGGYVKTQNCRVWGTENPNAYIEKPSHCLVRILVHRHNWDIFLRNVQGEAVTVNGDSYRVMLNEFFFTKIEEEDIGNIWFQQDSATWHTAEAILDGLRPVFEDPVISRRADVVWPTRSCDLTPLGYYLWGAAKDKPEIIDALKENIRKAIGEIQLHTIDNVLKNWTNSVGYCIASRGSHLNEIIIHLLMKGLYFQIKKKFEKIFSNFFKAFSKKKSYLADPVHMRSYQTMHEL